MYEGMCVVGVKKLKSGFCFPFSFRVSLGPTLASPVFILVAGVSSPRGWHGRCIATILHQDMVILVRYRLAELSQNVVIDMARLAAALKERTGVIEPSHSVLTRKQVRTDREQYCISVSVRLHVGLGSDPVKHTKGNLERFWFVLFNLCKRTCLFCPRG